MNNMILDLPCKIGDEMWGIREYRGTIHPQLGRVNEMFFSRDMKLVIVLKHVCRGEFNKKIFKTEEDAMNAIVDIEKNRQSI